MDDQQLMELLTQIQELAGVALDGLVGEQGPPPEGEEEVPEGEEGPPAE